MTNEATQGGLFVQSGLAHLFPYSSIATSKKKNCVVSGKWETSKEKKKEKKADELVR
jgi:hypothetical protein